MSTNFIIFAWILIISCKCTYASYCGQAAIPYSIEVLPNGLPVLGCARPVCFGWTASGGRAADPAQFYRIDGRPDGFLRASDVRGPVVTNTSTFQLQYSICDRSYLSEKCSGSSWVGGISPSSKLSKNDPLRLMCCYYNKLDEAAETGGVELHAGQIVNGGELRNSDGRVIAFEYIANIQRLFGRKGEPIYVVTMKKFSCFSQPPAITVIGDEDAANFLVANIQQSTSTTSKPTFASQKFDIPNYFPRENVQMDSSQRSIDTNKKELLKKTNGFAPIAKSMDDEENIERPPENQPRQAHQQQQTHQQLRAVAHSAPASSLRGNSVVDVDSSQSRTSVLHSQAGDGGAYYAQQQQSYNSVQAPLQQQMNLFSNFPQWFSPPFQQQYLQPAQQQQQQTLKQQREENQQAQAHQYTQQNQLEQKQQLSALNAFPLLTRGIVDSAQQPLIEIPTPEDIENVIPAESRRLLTNMARVVLSYFN